MYGKELLSQGGITELKSRIIHATSKLTLLSKESQMMGAQEGQSDQAKVFNTQKSLDLELELRTCYNLFYLLIYHNSSSLDDLRVLRELISLRYLGIEDMCYSSIKMSLQVPVTPIKKILIFFLCYLTLTLGPDEEIPPEIKNGDLLSKKNRGALLYTKQLAEYYTKHPPRWFLKDYSVVEDFYRRQMNKENPIPQIIVVCTLRVLLTTCPNTRRQSTGVDIAREWGSSLYYLLSQRSLYLQEGFESSGFGHSFLLGKKAKKQSSKKEESKMFLQKFELEDLIDDSEEEKSEEYRSCKESFPDLTSKDFLNEYEFEEQRHKLVVAGIIGELFLLLLTKFKRNCLMQYVYLIQLIVDANGVLVLLKFLNQDFSLFKQAQNLPLLFSNFGSELVMNQMQLYSVRGLLKLMRRTCEYQPERIKSFLVQYKAAAIMKKIVAKFGSTEEIRKLASKISKTQVKFMQKKWRQTNMKSISNVYKEVELRQLDDWLSWGDEWKASGELPNELTQDQIRHLHSEFNFRNYWQFHDREDAHNVGETRLQALDKEPMDTAFLKDYRKWLELEVWSYYD